MAVNGARQDVIFEPLPTNSERIKRLNEINPGLPIRLVQAAAGEKDGSAKFTVMSATSMGKLADSSFQQDFSSGDSINVAVVFFG